MPDLDHLLIFDVDPGRAALMASLLKDCQADGMISWSISTFHDMRPQDRQPSPGLAQLQTGLAALAIVVESGMGVETFREVSKVARHQGVATLAIIDPIDDPSALVERVRGYDGWLFLDSVDRELAVRVASMLDRGHPRSPGKSRPASIDARFLAMAIHDLRTPLNVIWLTIRAICQTVSDRTVALEEDMTFLQDNALQIKEMLEELSDYCRLMEGNSSTSIVEFDPRRLLSDLVEDQRERSGAEGSPLLLELSEDCPIEVMLDPARARLALKYALNNSIAAAGGTPVRIQAGGSRERWNIQLIVDKAPLAHVVSTPIRSDSFERIIGTAAERRGLDLTIAARISEIMGGSARLEVEPGRRSIVVLDWPQRITDS